jgi:hypothetical protein
MGKGKIQVWHVERREDSVKRLIRGTLKDVEALLRQEVDITPCTVEQARELADVEIESAEGQV